MHQTSPSNVNNPRFATEMTELQSHDSKIYSNSSLQNLHHPALEDIDNYGKYSQQDQRNRFGTMPNPVNENSTINSQANAVQNMQFNTYLGEFDRGIGPNVVNEHPQQTLLKLNKQLLLNHILLANLHGNAQQMPQFDDAQHSHYLPGTPQIATHTELKQREYWAPERQQIQSNLNQNATGENAFKQSQTFHQQNETNGNNDHYSMAPKMNTFGAYDNRNENLHKDCSARGKSLQFINEPANYPLQRHKNEQQSHLNYQEHVSTPKMDSSSIVEHQNFHQFGSFSDLLNAPYSASVLITVNLLLITVNFQFKRIIHIIRLLRGLCNTSGCCRGGGEGGWKFRDFRGVLLRYWYKLKTIKLR